MADQSSWDLWQNDMRGFRAGSNSFFQDLRDCCCGEGTPELNRGQDGIFFACRKCKRSAEIAPRGFGAAANWNALMDISNELTQEEKEQEWLERHWAKVIGQSKIQGRHRSIPMKHR